MRDFRCLLGRHKFSDWVEVGCHLERECLRCGKVEAKYPDPAVMVVRLATDLIWKYYMWKNPPCLRQTPPDLPIHWKRGK